MAATASAIRLSHALELLETQGLQNLADYLQRMRAKAKHAGAAKSLKRLVNEPRFSTAYQTTKELLKEGFEHPKTQEVIAFGASIFIGSIEFKFLPPKSRQQNWISSMTSPFWLL